jgi:hypothetical protein
VFKYQNDSLDIGCWDGFYSFEAEKHGADVVAVDCFRPEKFFLAKQALNSNQIFQADRPFLEFYPLPEWKEEVRINRLTSPDLDLSASVRKAAQECVQVIAPVPPALKPGQAQVRVFYQNRWSSDFEIALCESSQW